MKKIIFSSILCLMSIFIYSQTTDTFTGLGDYTWTAPSGVTQVSIDLWGTGGSGGNMVNGYGGSGGGGGGYSRKNNLAVIPLTTYSVHIGSAGGTTYFKDVLTVLANCGVSGLSGPTPDPLAGGLGGSVTGAVGDIKTAGGDGGEWTNTYGCGGSGGGSGGNGGNGGNGVASSGACGPVGVGGAAGAGTPGGAAGANGVSCAVAANAGTIPGSGGSGPGNTFSSNGPGGAGGSGQVSITYTVTATSVSETSEEISVVHVFQNPALGQYLITSNSEIESIEAFNMQGEKIIEMKNIRSAFSTINISEFAKGIYMVKIICGNKEVNKKIIKQ